MSADNQMVVAKSPNGWYVYMEQGDEPYSHDDARGGHWYKEFKDKLKAIEYASRICSEEIVEYGIRIDDEQNP